ncbi:MAG: PQQ-dependent dehydrogenase, methanol/ethanol family [Planctomycetes bacterium]|nr:PQQ-dependent dehydrogenase, methanol/ethanol family [Planctomycetota bacterium]
MHRLLLALVACTLPTSRVLGAEPPVVSPPKLVTCQRLVHAADEPGNWLMYSGTYNGQRHSRLRQIDDTNVHKLRVKWVRQFPTLSWVETTPLVVDGVMYATVPPNEVKALDARTGMEYWYRIHPNAAKLCLCCGKVNRGVAILGEKLYMGTLDAQLLAIDCRMGRKRWLDDHVIVADCEKGHSITAAPLIVKDMVVTGIAGGEFGIRGFLAAYDAKTGKERWRRPTIPGPGEPGNETWAGDSWKTGGAPTWMTGTYDPELNLIYWGVGNPGPDYNGEVRQGDNLYSDSVLALDADTGRIKWYFQFTPHDVWDWDSCQIPVLVDVPFRGKPRKLMLFANRNAFFYVLDRETGEFLLARAFAKQTWADGIDKKGRPKVRPDKLPSKDGTLVYPDVSGAANWWSPSYSPQTGLFYQLAFDGACKYVIGEPEPEPGTGKPYVGGGGMASEYLPFPDSSYFSAVRALRVETGEIVWEYRVEPKSSAGLLSTAGNLVFGGTAKGVFFALNATTGKELWRLDLGARVHAAPISYTVDGKQYVTIAAGNALFTFGL